MAEIAASPYATDQAGGRPAPMSGAPPFPAQSRVTLANWQEPPLNRWAFQHVRELIPTARISRGTGPARACRARNETSSASGSGPATAS